LWAKVGLGADKVGTLHALSGHRKGLIDPKIANQCSRTVKPTGDGALVEFPSAVDAVRCAIFFCSIGVY
jgi:adenylate cyclase